jgi:hypothetical protein
MAADRSPGGGVPCVCAPLRIRGIPPCDKPAHRRWRAQRIVRDSRHAFSWGPGETRRSLPFQRPWQGDACRQPALSVERLANASLSQTDDIRAHRQQNGDAYGDNDQEEFAHRSVSRRAQRQAAGIVLCWLANTPAFAKGPPSRRAFGSQGGTAIRSRRRNSR